MEDFISKFIEKFGDANITTSGFCQPYRKLTFIGSFDQNSPKMDNAKKNHSISPSTWVCQVYYTQNNNNYLFDKPVFQTFEEMMTAIRSI